MEKLYAIRDAFFWWAGVWAARQPRHLYGAQTPQTREARTRICAMEAGVRGVPVQRGRDAGKRGNRRAGRNRRGHGAGNRHGRGGGRQCRRNRRRLNRTPQGFAVFTNPSAAPTAKRHPAGGADGTPTTASGNGASRRLCASIAGNSAPGKSVRLGKKENEHE